MIGLLGRPRYIYIIVNINSSIKVQADKIKESWLFLFGGIAYKAIYSPNMQHIWGIYSIVSNCSLGIILIINLITRTIHILYIELLAIFMNN